MQPTTSTRRPARSVLPEEIATIGRPFTEWPTTFRSSADATAAETRTQSAAASAIRTLEPTGRSTTRLLEWRHEPSDSRPWPARPAARRGRPAPALRGAPRFRPRRGTRRPGRRGRDRRPQRPDLAAAGPGRAAADGPHARPRGAAAERDPRHRRDQPDPRGRSRRGAGGDRDHDRDQRPDRDLLLAAGDRRGRHLVPERRRPSGAAPGGRLGRHRCARDRLPRDRRPRPRRPPPGDRRRQRPPSGRLAASRLASARALGNRLVIPDRRLPGRSSARQQRGHARLPLVGEGPRHRDRHQSPARRRGARAPPLRREGASPRRRRQPRQHPLRRRAALDADDEHRADPPTADRARLLRLLRPALRGRPHLRPGAGRHRSGAPRRPQPGARRRPAADRPAALLRPGQGLGDDRPARPPGRHRGRRHPRRAAGDLHDVPRLRRGRPPLGDRTPRRPRRPPRPRSPDRRGSRRRHARRPVPTASSSSPTTASRRGKPFSIATANRSRTWSRPPATPRA